MAAKLIQYESNELGGFALLEDESFGYKFWRFRDLGKRKLPGFVNGISGTMDYPEDDFADMNDFIGFIREEYKMYPLVTPEELKRIIRNWTKATVDAIYEKGKESLYKKGEE